MIKRVTLSLLFFLLVTVFPKIIKADSPVVEIINFPSSVVAGEEFNITFNAIQLEISEYKVKALGGSNFTEVDTWNSTWYQQNSDWANMPSFTSSQEGTASATIKARFDQSSSGNKDLKIRIRKSDGNTNYDSITVSITVIASTPPPSPTSTSSPTSSSTPSPTSAPTPTKSPTPTPVKTKTPTPKPSPSSEPSESPLAFNESPIESPSSEPEVLGASSKPGFNKNLLPFFFIIPGVLLVGFAVYNLLSAKKDINQT